VITSSVRGSYLDQILNNTLVELAERKRTCPLSGMREIATQVPEPVAFASALRQEAVAVVAEVKRASPSKGQIASGVVATEVAQSYLDGGASAISVLTDRRYFGGSLDDLRDVSAVAVQHAVPVLRKDFVLDEYQVAEARAAGASAVLLIVAALTDTALRELLAVCSSYSLDALVEVHDERELERAVDAEASLIGINNRDLRSFLVDLATTERLAAIAPDHVTLVGESGIRTREDVLRLGRAGVHAVLVGETLMRAPDRAVALRELLT
jgi:indole-3-glycerol phosphate synthase